jgi:mRNA interferase MazF
MDNLNFGDIVLLKFPFTDGKNYKRRPALIINDFDDGDIIVCRITSQIYNTPFDVSIDRWKESGLKLPSVIRVHKFATLEKDLVEATIGKIDDPTKAKIKTILSKLAD